jgi:hypothetical protein
VSAAESVTFAAFPVFGRYGAPLETTGRIPAQFRAGDSCRNVPGTPGRSGRCSNHSSCQTWRPRISVLQDKRPSFICRRLRGSDTLLAPHIDTANQRVLSQRELCQEAFLATTESLLSPWTRRVPNLSWKRRPCSEGSGVRLCPSPALRMTDFEVSGAEHACTLLPGAPVHCRHCGAPNRLRHDEICLRRADMDHCKA